MRRHPLAATTALCLCAPIPALAQTPSPPPEAAQATQRGEETIIVQAKKRNQMQVLQSGQLGALGTKKSFEVPFSIKSYTASLILNQQPQTLGQVLETTPRCAPPTATAMPPNCSSSAASRSMATMSASTGCMVWPHAS